MKSNEENSLQGETKMPDRKMESDHGIPWSIFISQGSWPLYLNC